MFSTTIAIKVDVDTFEGMVKGVPRLLELFKKHGITASFFVPMGKDHTGRTVKRVFKKGFLRKAGRVGVLETYGLKTLVYGIVLPGPEIAKRNAGLLRRIAKEGHETGIHGVDHVYWHDNIKKLGRERTEKELTKAVKVYRDVTGESPRSFAAPGWMVNSHALRFFSENGFVYTSNSRGESPFYPRVNKETFSILEIPSTLPTLDETLGVAGNDEQTLSEYFLNCLTDSLNVISVHTELEGAKWIGFLDAFIDKALQGGYRFTRLIDIAHKIGNLPSIPVCDIHYGLVAGRGGEVTLQAGT